MKTYFLESNRLMKSSILRTTIRCQFKPIALAII